MPGGHGGPRGGASEKRCGKRKLTGGMWSGLRRTLYPRCPPGREQIIAEHACLKYSGWVGCHGARKTGHVRARYTGHLRGEKIRHLAFSNPLLKESLDDETTHDGRSRYDPYTS